MCCHGDKGAYEDKSRNIQGPCRETKSGQVIDKFQDQSCGFWEGMNVGSDGSGWTGNVRTGSGQTLGMSDSKWRCWWRRANGLLALAPETHFEDQCAAPHAQVPPLIEICRPQYKFNLHNISFLCLYSFSITVFRVWTFKEKNQFRLAHHTFISTLDIIIDVFVCLLPFILIYSLWSPL